MTRMHRLSAVSLALLMLACVAHATYSAERRMVLVSSDQLTLPPPSARDLRRLFLGVPIIKDGHTLVPLRNNTDPMLHEVFLQKIVFLSARNYEHHLLSQVFRLGGQRPELYSDMNELVSALKTRPGAVTYMWADTAQTLPGIRIVEDLWQGSTD
ncbi:MAG: hypothetical protein Q7U07_01525 [Gammaproteobacteria bacterium]|nr:hypothetical protein [Gammaproteobacteria bacterium]